MAIWKQTGSLEQINASSRNTMVSTLDIRIVEVGDDFLRGTMPVDERTRQPFGLLHGGASVALAETLGSLAGNLCLDPSKEVAVGLDINANHIRAVTARHRHRHGENAAHRPHHAGVGNPHRGRQAATGVHFAADARRRAETRMSGSTPYAKLKPGCGDRCRRIGRLYIPMDVCSR